MHRQSFESLYLRFRTQIIWQNQEALIIDPGVLPDDGERVQNFLKKHGLTVTHLLFTHTHGDHFACWQYFSDATTVGSQAILEKPEARKANDVKYVYSIWRKFRKAAPFTVAFPHLDLVLEDDQTVHWNNLTLHFFSAPGHSTDHGIFIIPEARVLFSGDMLIQIPQPFILQGFVPYYQSLQKITQLIQQFDIDTVVPAHGPELQGSKRILAQITRERQYIEAVVKKAHTLLQQGISVEALQKPLLEAFAINGNILHSHRVNINTLLREMERSPDNRLPLPNGE